VIATLPKQRTSSTADTKIKDAGRTFQQDWKINISI